MTRNIRCESPHEAAAVAARSDLQEGPACVRARVRVRSARAERATPREFVPSRVQCAEWDDHYVNTKYFFQRSSIPTNSALYAARARGHGRRPLFPSPGEHTVARTVRRPGSGFHCAVFGFGLSL